jgi:hypothetical protein
MDFNINLFTSPYDQYHIGPNIVPYTTNMGYENDHVNQKQNYDNMNMYQGYNQNKIEGMSDPNILHKPTALEHEFLSINSNRMNDLKKINRFDKQNRNKFLEDMNKARLDNNKLLYSSEIINPEQISNLTMINNQPSYGFNRDVGKWLPDHNLQNQLHKEINRNKRELVDGMHITNANFGDYPRNIYHFPFMLNDAERILNLNSDGFSSALNANRNEMNYGYGPASGSTNVNINDPINTGGIVLSNIQRKEGFNNRCGNKCNCRNINNYKQGFEAEHNNDNNVSNTDTTSNNSNNVDKKINELFNNNHFLWVLLVILLFICMCQYNTNKKLLNEIVLFKKQ